VRSGDITSAEKELDSLRIRHQELLDIKDSYKAKQVLIQMNSITAWILYLKGRHKEAIALMTEITQMEENTAKHPVTPGEVVPAQELLGDMYMAMNNPVEGLKVYELNLKTRPGRFNGIYSAAEAARRSGDAKKATQYFYNLLKLTEKSNSSRPELAEAREFVKGKKRPI
jgi:tetratricopeptide (TPR) repeat protein